MSSWIAMISFSLAIQDREKHIPFDVQQNMKGQFIEQSGNLSISTEKDVKGNQFISMRWTSFARGVAIQIRSRRLFVSYALSIVQKTAFRAEQLIGWVIQT
jgi:hypothetical protein